MAAVGFEGSSMRNTTERRLEFPLMRFRPSRREESGMRKPPANTASVGSASKTPTSTELSFPARTRPTLRTVEVSALPPFITISGMSTATGSQRAINPSRAVTVVSTFWSCQVMTAQRSGALWSASQLLPSAGDAATSASSIHSS